MKSLQLTLLGTGTSQGVPVIGCDCEVCQSKHDKDNRLRSSVLFEKGNTAVVIDTGPDFRQQMLRCRLQKLDAVVFTHEHKDHVAGLDDVRAYNFKWQMDMPIYAHPRVINALQREYHYAFHEKKYPGVPSFLINPIELSNFTIGDMEFTPIEVLHHQLPVLGFRVDDMAYITDAKTIQKDEMEKLFGLDVLVLNALRKETHLSHLTLEEALEWVELLQPKRTYFTHISHMLGKHEEVERMLPENVFLAYDGLQLRSE